jgi:hypothetical protein
MLIDVKRVGEGHGQGIAEGDGYRLLLDGQTQDRVHRAPLFGLWQR